VQVQIFGVRKSAPTRKALRFFSERRVRTHFVDLTIRPASRGELLRFVQRFGAEEIVDRNSRRFSDLGLRTAHYGEERWLELLSEEPSLLRLPLVRCENRLTVGEAEGEWKDWTGR